jgi:type I restriction enzyme S subunit
MDLGDFIELKRGYDLPKLLRENGKVPVVSSSGPSGTHARPMVKAPGVVTGRYGTIGEVFYIEKDFWPLNTTLYVKDFKGNDRLFVYYFLKTINYRAYSDKAAVPGINRNDVHKAKIEIPADLEDQREIASILRRLDQKIELNRTMNRTLESMAQAIFKSWFVDFDPLVAKAEGRRPYGMDDDTAALFPDKFQGSEIGPIPKRWSVIRVNDAVELSRASVTPKTHPTEIFAHYSIPSYGNGFTPITEEGASIKSNKYLINQNHVLLSKLNPEVQRVWIFEDYRNHRSICSTEFLVCEAREPITKAYIYTLFNDPQFRADLCGLVTGTSKSHQRVKPDDFLAMKTILPPPTIINAFDLKISFLLDEIVSLRGESLTLAKIRDTLLPKLLSGELRVKQAEKIVEEAM